MSFHATTVDLTALRRYRLKRIREQLRQRSCGGALFHDPINIRYACDCTNMQVWILHNAARYCFVATEGPVVLFDFHNCEHLSADLELVDEVRPSVSWYYFGGGPRSEENAGRWAAEIADLLKTHGGGETRLAIDKVDPFGLRALERLGVVYVNGQEVAEQARSVKNQVEIDAMMEAIRACEKGMANMRRILEPGISENELWAELHRTNIAEGGEWIETRLLTSGSRTNPWFQECSDRKIENGDLVSFDTDLVGPNGYCCDISRSWLCGDGKPSDRQRRLYAAAVEQIDYNSGLLKPGVSFRELAEKSWPIPQEFRPNRYSCILHGIGMCDEYPHMAHYDDYDRGGYDGMLLEGMMVCVESYIGEVDGPDGIKLEEQYLITDQGGRKLSSYPLEESWP